MRFRSVKCQGNRLENNITENDLSWVGTKKVFTLNGFSRASFQIEENVGLKSLNGISEKGNEVGLFVIM